MYRYRESRDGFTTSSPVKSAPNKFAVFFSSVGEVGVVPAVRRSIPLIVRATDSPKVAAALPCKGRLPQHYESMEGSLAGVVPR